MARDAEDTKRRLLRAAATEFAERGIAGARVDRIAAAASANKALIYSYFGNKEDLFDAVFHALVVDTVEDVPIDPDDLPGYAARLFDRTQEQPYALRLALWHCLERDHAAGRRRGERAEGRGRRGRTAGRSGLRPVPGRGTARHGDGPVGPRLARPRADPHLGARGPRRTPPDGRRVRPHPDHEGQ